MSYALETKKRKFDRILESLTDSSGVPPLPRRTSLNSRNNSISEPSRASIDASKRRKVTPILHTSDSRSSLGGHYLPSSRTAFLDRLESYRHVTKWHIPSTGSINAVAWAKRGWICVDRDTVCCGSCKERVTVDLEVDKTPYAGYGKENGSNGDEQETAEQAQDDEEVAELVYHGLVKRYSEMVIESHADNCPWKKRGCDNSIQRIEGLLNSITAVSSVRDRYSSISENAGAIPKVSSFPSTEAIEIQEEELNNFDMEGEVDRSLDTLRLATCGWQRKEDDVIECKHCFRSLGLWLYRGESPSMEHLDAVDSHLEYCPWRSAEAQDTTIELAPSGSTKTSQRVGLPGWILVYMAIAKHNARRKGNTFRQSFLNKSRDTDASSMEEVSPEQRDKKMKDLMRRIREIKKPFNVKSLLKKKDKAG